MWMRLAAMAAFAASPCVQATPPDAALSLDTALSRVAQAHPELGLIAGRQVLLEAEREHVAQKPSLALGVELENVFGSGEFSALDQAELSVSLAGVLERGGKLDARRTLAQARIDALAPQRERVRLDLLAELARRYLAVSIAQQRHAIALLDIDQRQRALAAAQRRLQAGASPESVVLGAAAALAQAELDRDRARQQQLAARRQLAASWGQHEADFTSVSGDPLRLPELADFAELAAQLQQTPELALLAGDERVRQAQLRLAQTQRQGDLEWQLGVKLLRDGNDAALVAGVSLPLASRANASSEIRIAEAELALSAREREALQLQLYATLAEADGRYRTAQLEVARLHHEVLPLLTRAELAAEKAWRAGAISYLEWAQLQSQRIEARSRQLEAATTAHTALIEIQRLTGQAFVASASHLAEDTHR